MPTSTSLWRHPDFLKLWAGQTLGSLCSNITTLAVPIFAVTSLDASAFEMGLLGTAATIPNLLASLLAGSVVDRVRRRRILITADVGRGLLLLCIPLTAALGSLELWQLYGVLFLAGILTTFYDVADNSYLPSLVGVEQLVSANSKLMGSSSVATAVGPGAAGGLIQLLTAPIAILVDAISFFISAMLVMRIRQEETAPDVQGQRNRVWLEAVEGLRMLSRDPLLRSFAMSSTVYFFFGSTTQAVYVLYATDALAIAPGTLGLIYLVGGVGSVVGAMLAEPSARRFGPGTAMIVANLIGGLSYLSIPFVQPGAYAVPLLMVAQFGLQSMGGAFAIVQTSLRQARTPDHALGRVNASYRFLTMGIIPVGMFVGGVIGEAIGLRGTVLVGGIGVLLPTVILFLSPARTVRTVATENG